jgi:hypothetical protein
VVGVEVRDEDLAQLDQPDSRAQHLPLRAFAAVEQQPLSPAPQQQGRGRALRGRNRARGSEEDEIEIHGPIVGLPPP